MNVCVLEEQLDISVKQKVYQYFHSYSRPIVLERLVLSKYILIIL